MCISACTRVRVTYIIEEGMIPPSYQAPRRDQVTLDTTKLGVGRCVLDQREGRWEVGENFDQDVRVGGRHKGLRPMNPYARMRRVRKTEELGVATGLLALQEQAVEQDCWVWQRRCRLCRLDWRGCLGWRQTLG